MPASEESRIFPTDDSLCERCGYPLRGLPIESDCPECGQAVAESSPGKRTGPLFQVTNHIFEYLPTAALIFFFPHRSFRLMQISGGNVTARRFLLITGLLAGIPWAITGGKLIFATPTNHWRHIALCCLVIVALTYLEMLGVTAFSRRRGWRVPFRLAERVCCYASVGWIPGVILAGIGVWLLDRFAVGQPWFESLLGLVRVSWLCYGGLFVLSLLWFETLVWIGVRQVRYANAWPAHAQPTDDPQLTDN